ncbi:phosphoribosylanthranilate isomerase [Stackebrandtia soli]|uniref:phosphoribosylanthranilate isomerase n=1 Tax=Stackebrandtia soli TaxID=1892856 RepID=UPI0039EBAFD0
MFVKICGLTEEDHVNTAVDAGADAIGFVLTDSPRKVVPERAYELAELVPRSLLTVAVFAGLPSHAILPLAQSTGVDAIQLHGDYALADFEYLSGHGFNLIRAVSGETASDLTTGAFGEDLLIVDAPEAGAGRTWDFSGLTTPPSGRWLLAGGLTVDNVADAIAKASPWGVDVSSGVESSRGIKDPTLIRAFVEKAKATAPADQ